MELNRRNLGTLLLAACVLMGLGVFLPWLRLTAPFVGTITKAGIQGDGVFLLALAVVTAVCAAFYLSGVAAVGLRVTMLVLALLSAGLVLFEVIDAGRNFSQIASDSLISIGFDIGFYVVGIAAIALVVGAVLTLRKPVKAWVSPRVEEKPTREPASNLEPAIRA